MPSETTRSYASPWVSSNECIFGWHCFWMKSSILMAHNSNKEFESFPLNSNWCCCIHFSVVVLKFLEIQLWQWRLLPLLCWPKWTNTHQCTMKDLVIIGHKTISVFTFLDILENNIHWIFEAVLIAWITMFELFITTFMYKGMKL